MRYAALKKNDCTNGQGVCVSLWTQGCPHRCPGCHNPETWSFDGGIEKNTNELIKEIIESISANGIDRNFSILGGEPLCDGNAIYIWKITEEVKKAYPDIKIYLWTGYTIKYLIDENAFEKISSLKNVDYLIDGRYIESQKDLSLFLRGSKNQNLYELSVDSNKKLCYNKL